ncbi:MAG: hypothetical protein SGI74_10740 [Oligoflexia bacterium]|nr:hypothetical protein [Oligoflexia bacterium]
MSPYYRQRILYLVVALIAVILYVPALWCGFVTLDDPLILLENPTVKNFNLIETFKYGGWGQKSIDYIPLTIASYALEYSLFGLDPFYYHLNNLVLYVIICLLFILFLQKLKSEFFIVAAAAMVFMSHPVHVESVAWVTERKDLLCTVFFCFHFFFIPLTKRKIQKQFIGIVLRF